MKRATMMKTLALVMTLALCAPAAAAVGESKESATGETTGLINPWTELTEKELEKVSGVSFNVPEGAKDVVYRWLEEDNLAEMQFVLGEDEYCARIKPDSLKVGELDDISGMYFKWEHEEEVTIGHCPGTLSLAKDGSEDYVERCLWYDLAPGLMYSLSVNTIDPDGLDLTAVAEMVYEPMQGDA